MQPKSLTSVETASQNEPLEQAQATSEDFWRNTFAALKENGVVQAHIPAIEGLQDQLNSLLAMHGFTDIQFSNSAFAAEGSAAFIARKPAFKAGGTSLKNRKKTAASAASACDNPWANLATTEANQINEDSLMVDEQAVNAMTTKFAGDQDRIMPGKPCDNCTCGKKELFEGTVTKDQLENGQFESSCGKCYLGDAFRCGGCPFRGKPAFEPGDKVRLTDADTSSAAQDASMIRAQQVSTTQTGSTKVVLEL